MPDRHDIGDVVTITKLRLKLSQISEPNYVIAAMAHIHPTQLSDYAQGKKPLSAKHLVALCQLFKCDPEEIIGEVEVEIKE